MSEVRCWICGEEAFAWGGKVGLRSILFCRDCFCLTNGEETVKSLKAKALTPELAERIARTMVETIEDPEADWDGTVPGIAKLILRVRDGAGKEERSNGDV